MTLLFLVLRKNNDVEMEIPTLESVINQITETESMMIKYTCFQERGTISQIIACYIMVDSCAKVGLGGELDVYV